MASGMARLSAIHAMMERGDVAGAVQAIAAVVADEPDNGPAWHLAGVIRRRAGDAEGALEAFAAAFAAGIESAELRNSMALTLEELGRLDAAEDALSQALVNEPGYLPARINAARLAALRGRTREAVSALRAVLAENPASALASNTLATILSDAGEAGAAASQYRHTLANTPDNLAAAVRLGLALREDGRAAEAAEHFRNAAPRFAGAPEFTEAMCGALVDLGQVAEAEATLEQLVAQVPGYFAAHRALARLAREYATGKDPYRSYRNLVARWPGEAAIWLDWFALMLDHRDYAGVVELAGQARARLGERADIDFYEAVARGETGAAALAESLFARAGKAVPGNGAFLCARARNALRRGEPAQAEALARAATELDQTDQFGWAYLGLAWRMLDDPREFWLHDYDLQTEQRIIPCLAEPDGLEQLRATLRRLHRAAHHPPDQSLRGGTQTEGALFKRSDPVIRRLRDAIREQVEAFVEHLPQDETHPFYRRRAANLRFIGSWSVRLTGQGFHIAHIHQAGWISSALHVTVPPRSEGEPAHAGALVLGEAPAELGLDLPARRVVQPVEGALVLFPSSMWHGTVPFAGGHERMTVAFDVTPVS
jgi:predicted Zn-dependent protease